MDATKKIGRYEILEELGRGAMGIVYRANDPAMERVVALKTIISVVLTGSQGQEFRDRFFREARTAGALAHPGIVAVFDVGEHDGTPYLVMEFVAGRTLADASKHGERMSMDRVCEFGAQIAGALGYAHQRGVVHRDIKPANILLTSVEAYGIERPKITDFGVAKLAEGQTTLTGQMLGTPAYMPPEQFTGAQIDNRTDIFSLGVVLYWMATGEQPFPGATITAVSYKVVHTEPVPPRKLNPAIPLRLEAAILKCLAKNPAERYQTGEELARDLNDLRTGDKTATGQSAATQVAPAKYDPDATLIDAPLTEGGPKVATTLAATAKQDPEGAQRSLALEGKRNNRLALVAGVVAIVAAAGWYFSRSGQNSPVQDVTSTPSTAITAPVPSPVAAATGTISKNVVGTTTSPAGASPKPATSSAITPTPSGVPAKKLEATAEPTVNATLNATVPPKAAETAPEPSALGFDPKTLDRKQNARLELDAARMPPAIEFTIEMNGKLYFHKTGSGPLKRDDELFVPPGVHEFRVTARSGDIAKTSNTVSTEFKANKRNTMKVELRVQGMPPEAGVPQGLYENSQLVLTLK